ncbi:hypothetical protein MHLP_02735 [Candidatus Mycoplasma haematolamae str. Purdue]|uniref:Uncharacterized protein n=1 Tax=Mycoplasma haematolamae (strain Purdue) TaxID=1212765 RepID=I7C6I2_MYCHA|nr:hypothetical protein [Candidatus Mycoplasma haematolamae]AFO52127.1 hypothetical protein MHLP_02735 [Candidatus Mycoplasma haematolamae str. Purdue]
MFWAKVTASVLALGGTTATGAIYIPQVVDYYSKSSNVKEGYIEVKDDGGSCCWWCGSGYAVC